jgi:uncharacterized protein
MKEESPSFRAGSVNLIDHHVHGVVTTDLDRAGFEDLLAEGQRPADLTMFDTQLGFAIRRWCAPALDLKPFASPDEYLRRRAELGVAEVNGRLLRAAGVRVWLVDTGFRGDRLTTPEQLAAASGAPARPVIRLEAVAERVVRDGTSATGFADSFAAALTAAPAVGYKSVVAYRFGFDFDPGRPSPIEVAQAASRVLGAQSSRIEEPVLLRHLIWTAIDIGLPLQFHVGFGDTDVRLHRSNPSLLHDFLLATQPAGTPIMLLHCYPFQREAGYLANVFPHVYMDLGAILNHVGARSTAVLAEALELTPFHKMLYSSDAFGLPELHYLGAIGFRRDLAQVIDQFVDEGLWAKSDAGRISKLIGFENAARVYRLELA